VTKSSENKNNEQVEIAIVPESIVSILTEMQTEINGFDDRTEIDTEILNQITNILKNDKSGFNDKSQMVDALEELVEKLSSTGELKYKSKAIELQTEIDKL